jgi:hypothetical protein
MDAVALHVPHPSWSDPIPAPDWRWQIACHLHERARLRRRRRRQSDPEWLQALLALSEVLHPSGRRGRSRRPVTSELMAAHQLYQSETPLRWEVEARILAGQSDNEVALPTALPPAVVAAFEQFFFNVRDRLAAADCILFGLIGFDPVRGFEEADLRGLWQYFGYTAGPKMLELVMAVTLDRRLPDWAIEEAPDPASIEQLRTSTKLAILATRRFSGDPRKLLTLRVQALELRRNSEPNLAQALAQAGGLDCCFGLADLAVAVESPKKVTSRPVQRKSAAVA